MNHKKMTLYALLLSLGIGALTSCKKNEEYLVTNGIITTKEPSIDESEYNFYQGEDVVYDEIIKNAFYDAEKNIIDFYQTVDVTNGIYAIIANDEVGLTYDTDFDRIWDELYFGGLSIDQFCTRVFDSKYDAISIGEFFTAKRTKDGQYKISYVALNKDKDFYFEGDSDEYYIPNDLTKEKEVGKYKLGEGTVSEERAKELFQEQISCWFINMNAYLNKNQNENNNSPKIKENKITI